VGITYGTLGIISSKREQDGIGKYFVIEVGIQLYDFDFRPNFILKSLNKSNDSLWIVEVTARAILFTQSK